MEPQGNYKYLITRSECHLHGEGVADCSDWPDVSASFYIQFWRNDSNDKSVLTWDTSDWNWSYDNGHFGYQFQAAIAVNPANKYYPDWDTELWTILEKTHTGDDGNSWWSYAQKYAPGPHTVTSTSNTAKLCIYVAERECMHSSGGSYEYCFDDGRSWYLVGEIDMEVPAYETFYTVQYNANGGTQAPASQTKSSLSNLTLTTAVPNKSVRIQYQTSSPSILYAARQFSHWLGNGVQYQPGGTYSTNANVVMYAQWGVASFIPEAIPPDYVTLMYETNGGSIISPSRVQRPIYGYSTSQGSSTIYCQPGVQKDVPVGTDTLILYPVVDRYATIIYTNLPTPSRTGYTFNGWYKDVNLTQKITANFQIDITTTIYAGWTALPIHKETSSGWEGTGPYVWQRGSDNQWHKVAHVRKYTGSQWIDISDS